MVKDDFSPAQHLTASMTRRTMMMGLLVGGALIGVDGVRKGAHAEQSATVTAPGYVSQPARRAVLLSDSFRPVAGWKRYGVIMSKDQPWESDLLQDPSIVYNSGSGALFKCWYGSLHGIGYATSADGKTWTKAPTPVVSPTLSSEQGYLNQPSVVLKDGVWHMTYFGMDTSGKGQIHYASATAPEGPWVKGGVVLAPDAAWEDNFLYNSCLLFDGRSQTWKMWYTAGKIASAGGEPEFICHATAPSPAGPWAKHASNPLVRPMNDGGWASLGVGGPNVRIMEDGSYESRIIGWQADHPSRAGRITSPDGLTWDLNRASMDLDLGIVGGPEDSMIYRSFELEHNNTRHLFYNVKNNRPGWNETINLAIWAESLDIVDPAKWAMTHAQEIPTGASFEVRDGSVLSLGNAPARSPQMLQGNAVINARDYSVAAVVTPTAGSADGRDTVLQARVTTRDRMYYAGISSWGHKYAIGILTPGANRKLVGVGSAQEISAGTAYRLRFEVQGSQLRLFDGDQLVAAVEDSTHQPAQSYVGLQSSFGFGTAAFRDVEVRQIGVTDAFAVEATASTRCVAGKMQVVLTVKNADVLPFALAVHSPYGTREAKTLEAGKSTSFAFNTRAGSVADVQTTVLVSGTINGKVVKNELTVTAAGGRC